MTHKPRDDVGTISIEDDAIRFSSPAPYLGEWRFPISEIAIIGEFTNENGPFLLDWFVAFVGSDAQWSECPANAKGIHAVLETLQERLDCELQTSLYWSTRFISRIMYPRTLVEQPLFAFKPLPWSIWRFWRVYCVSQELSVEAKGAIAVGLSGTR